MVGFIILVAIAILIVILVLRNIYELNNFNVTRINIADEKINKDMKLIFLSDLHERIYGVNNCRLFDAIKNENPDAILIGGDMFISMDGNESLTDVKKEKKERTVEFIKELTSLAPVYYAFGNHEIKLVNKEAFKPYFNGFKDYVTILDDESKEIRLKGEATNVFVTGLTLERKLYLKFKNATMEEGYIEGKIGDNDNTKYNILLAHSPLFYENYVKHGKDLVLCGHYHGEFFISPQFIPFPKHHAGVFKDKKTTMVVSRGIGSHTVNIRIRNKPEIIVLQLSNK